MLLRLPGSVLLTIGLAAAAPAQTKSEFQSQLTQTLGRHAFFRNVSFEIDSKRPPFLFVLQGSLQGDVKNYDRLVINPIHRYLHELLEIFDTTYCKPQGIAMREDAKEIAIAVLSSRGLYEDYARATRTPSLHSSLAHYNPELRLAVTYRAGFGSGDANEERHSLLHEVVHALQHAHSSTGAMPKPIWYAEGLAEYRASHDNLARSLREPPRITEHMMWMDYLCHNDEGRKLMLPIAELVVPESYGDAVAAIRKHSGSMVTDDAALGLMYAESEMLVRFLHEAGSGKYRDGFLRYFKAVESGASGLATFETAFAVATAEARAAMEKEWLEWLSTEVQQHLGYPVGAAGGKGAARVAMTPPVAFDRKTLAWQDDELPTRLTGAHRLCSLGEFEAALAMLPEKIRSTPELEARLHRARRRLQATVELRDRVIADMTKRRDIKLGGSRGRFVRLDGHEIVLKTRTREERIAVGPSLLLEYGESLDAFKYANCWLEAWLRWLGGESLAAMGELVGRGYSDMKELVADLEATLDASYGTEALAIERLQQRALPDKATEARQALAELTALTRLRGPLVTRRQQALEDLTRALAERAFALDDADALGIHGTMATLGDNRVRIEYSDATAAPDADFSLAKDAPFQFVNSAGIAYNGPTCVRPQDGHWGVIGNGFLRW
ncbi:MAG: hypothetical protein KDC98_01340, partial [Planctomycetes bacterium]|nr:hypothetical protein [Planctomycetota bacterium]